MVIVGLNERLLCTADLNCKHLNIIFIGIFNCLKQMLNACIYVSWSRISLLDIV
jgi:hypothetical protein